MTGLQNPQERPERFPAPSAAMPGEPRLPRAGEFMRSERSVQKVPQPAGTRADLRARSRTVTCG